MPLYDVHVFYVYRLKREKVLAENPEFAVSIAQEQMDPYRLASAELSIPGQGNAIGAHQVEFAEEISHYLVDVLNEKGERDVNVESIWLLETKDGPVEVVDGRHEANIIVSLKDGKATVHANRPDVCVHVINHDAMTYQKVELGSDEINVDPKLEEVDRFVEKYGDRSLE